MSGTVKIIDTKELKEGKVCMAKIQNEEKMINLINIYAPNKDSPSFFLDIFNEIKKIENRDKCSRIIAGDLNLGAEYRKG